MFSQFVRRSLVKGQNAKALTRVSAMNFRSTPAASQKLGIGDAADILEQKISGISQVVSRYFGGFDLEFRMILRNSERLFHSEMELLECLD